MPPFPPTKRKRRQVAALQRTALTARASASGSPGRWGCLCGGAGRAGSGWRGHLRVGQGRANWLRICMIRSAQGRGRSTRALRPPRASRFELAKILLGDVRRFVPAAHGGVRPGVRGRFGFDSGADALADRFGRNTVLAVVGLLHRPATPRLVVARCIDWSPRRRRDHLRVRFGRCGRFVCIKTFSSSQKALLGRVENGHERHLGQGSSPSRSRFTPTSTSKCPN